MCPLLSGGAGVIVVAAGRREADHDDESLALIEILRARPLGEHAKADQDGDGHEGLAHAAAATARSAP